MDNIFIAKTFRQQSSLTMLRMELTRMIGMWCNLEGLRGRRTLKRERVIVRWLIKLGKFSASVITSWLIGSKFDLLSYLYVGKVGEVASATPKTAQTAKTGVQVKRHYRILIFPRIEPHLPPLCGRVRVYSPSLPTFLFPLL